MLVDLHNHSYYSDGVYTPSEVAIMAKNSGCHMFALTDHDTTNGVLEAQLVAKELGVNFVSGVEISTTWNNMTIHIVGLGIDISHFLLQECLLKHQKLRQVRAQKIANGLSAAGIHNAFEKTQKFVQKQMITRTHFARMLINEGICKDMVSVFKRYLTGKKPGSVNVSWSDLEAVINLIHKSGGLAVVAHPLRYRTTNTKTKRLLADFKNYGGDGIEVITGSSTLEDINLTLAWSQKFNLMQSSGSDFHGDNHFIKVGHLKNVNLSNPIWHKLCY